MRRMLTGPAKEWDEGSGLGRARVGDASATWIAKERGGGGMDGQEMTDRDEGRLPRGEEPAPQRYFGPRLVELRDNLAERMARPKQADAMLIRARPTAKALVACLQDQGYAISAATLSEIEGGSILP